MSVVPLPPRSVGRLLTPEQVANEIFGKKVTAKWVRTHISVGRIRMGHRTIFYEEDTLRAWLARQVETA